MLYEYKSIDTVIQIKPFDIYIEDRNKYIKEANDWENAFFAMANNSANHKNFSYYKKQQFQAYVSLNNFL